jgi:ABC-2 type transport system permease protein
MVSIERAAGWSRQIRVTPLSPLAYIITKMVSSLVLAAGSVIVVNVVAVISQKPSMPVQDWIACALLVWIGSLVFAALGVFIGYLLPAENVMQIIGVLLALTSFAGGLLIPLSQLSPGVRAVAKFTPLFGLNQLVHVPLVGGAIQPSWVLNLVVWFAIFVGGATWRLRLDTGRV